MEMKFNRGDIVVPVGKAWWKIGVVKDGYRFHYNFLVEPIRYSVSIGVIGLASATDKEMRLATQEEWDNLKHYHFTPEMIAAVEQDPINYLEQREKK